MDACEERSPAEGGFELSADASEWTFSGALTFDNAAAVVESATSLALPASGRIDLSRLGLVDSSALAALFALKRRASAEGRALVFEGMPSSLASLAQLYGVAELLSPTSA